MMLETVELITQVGFPIVVSLILLFRVERTIMLNTKVLTKIEAIIDEWCRPR